MSYSVHKNAILETENVGSGTRIWAFAHILKGAIIGSNCNICDHTFIENDVVIGNRVTIKSGVYIWNGAIIHDDVFIGPNVTFTNDLLPRSKKYPEKFKEIIIEQGASIGANATIVAGNRIGRYAMIGAGSVITKDIPPYTLWYGNPALFKGYVCECGKRLNKKYICESCSKSYPALSKNLGE